MKRGTLSGILLILPCPATAGTCALCREALRLGGGEGLIRGFYWSIVIILAISLAILFILVRIGLKAYHR